MMKQNSIQYGHAGQTLKGQEPNPNVSVLSTPYTYIGIAWMQFSIYSSQALAMPS